MASVKDLLNASDIDSANEAEATAAIELASDYLNREDFEEVPAPVKVGVQKLCAVMVKGDFGAREVQSKKAGDLSITYADVSTASLPREALNYLHRYRYVPGL